MKKKQLYIPYIISIILSVILFTWKPTDPITGLLWGSLIIIAPASFFWAIAFTLNYFIVQEKQRFDEILANTTKTDS